MKEATQSAEVYVFELDNKICGFVGLVDDYIAGIFVEINSQNSGIGTEIINYVKRQKENLSLNVYVKNKIAVEFYKKHHFTVSSESIAEDTNQPEYLMSWER